MFYVDTTTKFANVHPSNTVVKTISTGLSNGTQFTLHSRQTITPGLLANGSPTTNASLTVAASSIKSTDDYDYITNFEEFFDGDGTG